MTSGFDEPLAGVSETALGAAEMRAEESARVDRLFGDPYAAAFVAAAPPLFPDLPSIVDDPALAELKNAFLAEIAIRTRFYDDYLSAACIDGCRQVVLLAAGLDAHAFRLDWPAGTRVFEIDLPGLFEFKERVLAQRGATPACLRTVVPADFRTDWATRLSAAGFEASARSAWTAEGLLAYLANDDVLRLLGTVGDLSAIGSRLAFEYDDFVDDSTLSRAREVPGMERVTSMWEGGLHQDPKDWLRRRQWRIQTYERATLGAGYGRPLSDGASGGFLTATRHERE